MSLRIGEIVYDSLEVLSFLGDGMLGKTYKANYINSGKSCVLRAVHSGILKDSMFIPRLKKEIEVQRNIPFKEISKLTNYFYHRDNLIIVSEYVQGFCLKELSLKSSLQYKDLIDIFQKLTELLSKIIEINFSIGSLKISNIFLDKYGNLKFKGAGINRILGSKKYVRLMAEAGNLPYVSPEQLYSEEELESSSDIYVSGIILLNLVTGKLPFFEISHSDYLVMDQIVNKGISNYVRDSKLIPADLQNVLIEMTKAEKSSKVDLISRIKKCFQSANFSKNNCTGENLFTIEKNSQTKNVKVVDDFVLVEGGEFMMGFESGESKEKPVHSVILTDFYIAKYAVTQKDWKEIMGKNPSFFKQKMDEKIGNLGFETVVQKQDNPDHPVDSISWYEAIEFCNQLSIKKGLNPFYNIDKKTLDPNNHNDFDSLKWTVKPNWGADGYRLPTETEWVYACKGGKQSSNFKYSGSNNLDEVAWFCENSSTKTHQVGQKKPNELGLYDMSGNVWEWCWDWFGSFTTEKKVDPQGPDFGSYRVNCGGSWNSRADYCRPNYRYEGRPNRSGSYLGLRLVRSKT